MPVGVSSLGLGRTIYVNSGAVTASSATPNMKNNTLYGTIPAAEAVDIILNVTNFGGNAATTTGFGAWVELQTSPDGGTTWIPFWRSPQIISTSTAIIRTSMRTNGIGANESATGSTAIQTASGAITQNCVVTEDQRVVWTQVSTNNNSPTLTFGLYAICQTAGSRASY